jgi:hypothetical protein
MNWAEFVQELVEELMGDYTQRAETQPFNSDYQSGYLDCMKTVSKFIRKKLCPDI